MRWLETPIAIMRIGVFCVARQRIVHLKPDLRHPLTTHHPWGEMPPHEERERRLREGSLETYVHRGRGGIYVTTTDQRGANPLELVLQVAPTMREAFQPWLARVRALSSASIQSIINAVPETLMDSTAKRFTVAFVEYTRTQLCLL